MKQRSGKDQEKYSIVVLPKSSKLNPGNGIIGTRRSTYVKVDGKTRSIIVTIAYLIMLYNIREH